MRRERLQLHCVPRPQMPVQSFSSHLRDANVQRIVCAMHTYAIYHTSFIFSPPYQQMLETLSNRARKSKKKACCRRIPSAASVGSFGDSGIFAPRFRILWQPALSLFLLCKLSQRESPIRRVNHFLEAYNARQQISIVHLPSAIMPAARDDHPRTSEVWFSPPQ